MEYLECENYNETERQIYFINKIRRHNDRIFMETGIRPKAHQKEFGCQMNARDSEKLIGMLWDMGYEYIQKEEEADFIIYNTCCVRENAEKKVFGKLGYLKTLKREKPDMTIALCGCMMQEPHVVAEIQQRYKHVDLVFGTFNLHTFPELVHNQMAQGEQVVDIWDNHREIVEDLPSLRKYPYKAGVNIMFGCDNFCSYCIVPYVRGRERSRRPEEILDEIEKLAADGVKEIMLLGQNVNSYGKNLDKPFTFAELVQRVNEVKGIERIRFMTSHPKDLSEGLIKTMRDCEHVCKSLHLPLQSGSSSILKKMNRHYSKESYLSLIEAVKSSIPDMLITTDIIVGFPGETEEDFEDTLDVVKKVQFAGAYTFLYSKRTGTPAADLRDQVPEDVMKDRFNRLLDTINPIVNKIHQSVVGKTLYVLPEEINKDDPHMLTGRADNNMIVHFKGDRSLIGKLVPVLVTGHKTFYVLGESIRS